MKNLDRLIAEELAQIRIPQAQEKCKSLISIGKPEERRCPHTKQSRLIIPIVPDKSGVTVCYLAEEAYPWGIVNMSSDYLPTDDRWFISLEDAFYHSPAWDNGELPLDYELL